MANGSTVTYSGRSLLWGRMRGLSTEPLNLKWGVGGGFTGAANSDVALFSPATETGVVGTSTAVSTTQLADTYQVTGTMTCLVAPKTITEVALSDTTTLSPTTTITASMTAAQTTVLLGAASGIATGNYYRQIGNEVVLVTGGQNTTTETIVRAQFGSVAGAPPVSTPTTVGGDGGAHANYSVGSQTATIGAANGGSLFSHSDFGGLSLNVSDSILFQIKDTLT